MHSFSLIRDFLRFYLKQLLTLKLAVLHIAHTGQWSFLHKARIFFTKILISIEGVKIKSRIQTTHQSKRLNLCKLIEKFNLEKLTSFTVTATEDNE